MAGVKTSDVERLLRTWSRLFATPEKRVAWLLDFASMQPVIELRAKARDDKLWEATVFGCGPGIAGGSSQPREQRDVLTEQVWWHRTLSNVQEGRSVAIDLSRWTTTLSGRGGKLSGQVATSDMSWRDGFRYQVVEACLAVGDRLRLKCANPKCEKPYLAAGRRPDRQRFCSPKCSDAVRTSRHRQRIGAKGMRRQRREDYARKLERTSGPGVARSYRKAHRLVAKGGGATQ
jgi:hypothetical protein